MTLLELNHENLWKEIRELVDQSIHSKITEAGNAVPYCTVTERCNTIFDGAVGFRFRAPDSSPIYILNSLIDVTSILKVG